MYFLSFLFLSIFFSLESNEAANPPKADFILLEKAQRRLTLFSQGRPIKEYQVALGFAPSGPKEKEGDGKTPEGKYKIDRKNAQSQFYKSIRISYPNEQDRARAKRSGYSPGGDIYIHGLGRGFGSIGAGHRLKDWTLGCAAVTNEEIDEIWNLVDPGTLIEIKP